jgi:hypothetical protein
MRTRAGDTRAPASLLDLDLGAGFFELLLDRRRFVLVDAFLDGLRRGLDEVLGLLEAEARHFADDLDDVDLVAADIGQRDGELGLLFGRRCAAARRRYFRMSRSFATVL